MSQAHQAIMLPAGTCALVERSTWTLPPVFEWLRQRGRIEPAELLRTFNCGVGMVLAVAEARSDAVLEALGRQGEDAWTIGRIEPAGGTARVRFGG